LAGNAVQRTFFDSDCSISGKDSIMTQARGSMVWVVTTYCMATLGLATATEARGARVSAGQHGATTESSSDRVPLTFDELATCTERIEDV